MADLIGLIDVKGFRATAQAQAQPLQRALYEVIRQAIAEGRLAAGAVLPASRELAHELGMGRNGVIHAYEQLAAEGYVQASRLGTVVAALPAAPSRLGASRSLRKPVIAPEPACVLSARVQACDRRRSPEQDLLPFMPGVPALDAFPNKLWCKLQDRAARHAPSQDLGYRHAVGEPELRQAIATYLRASRGVQCDAAHVTVTQGTQHSLELCAHILADEGDTVWIEHPGYGGARTAFVQAGLALQPVTVDAEGIAPPDHWWQDKRPRFVYTTPSHQYPLGSVLSLPRRLHLIEQARRAGSWLLEDDYDSEFRHDGPPLAAMQGQVPDAPVVYLGTFSKSMFPALRMGFIVWPAALADRVAGVVGELVRGGRPVTQRALAEFINEGHYTRHLRRMRRLYALRQACLRDALARHWPYPGQIVGGQAGLHLVMSLPGGQGGLSDRHLAQQALASGLSPRPLSAYGSGGVAGFNGLVMGYANTHEDVIASAVKRLARVADALPACVP
ncbi:MAG: PLP-dependent aminotransferase family protein [Aquabacterium sp.]